MSRSGSQAAAFFREARQSGVVRFVRDDEGSPAPLAMDGTRSLPYWSTTARAQKTARIWGMGYVLNPCPCMPGAIAICLMPPKRDT